MIEMLIVIVLLLLIMLLKKPQNIETEASTDEKINNPRKQQTTSIVGESRFILDDLRKKKVETIEPVSDTSGKMDIEVPLDYETEDTNAQEEQEELESLDLNNNYSKNITFEEMMKVVNEVGNNLKNSTPETGKLLYENENTDWVEQLASSSENSSKRITSLIDLHLGRLEKPNSDVKLDEGLKGFDIGEFVR